MTIVCPFRHKREEVTSEWRDLRDDELHNSYWSSNAASLFTYVSNICLII
jgi:hypothetical protein